MALLVSNPQLSRQTMDARVETRQVAPSILLALGLDPSSLQSLRQEPVQALARR